MTHQAGGAAHWDAIYATKREDQVSWFQDQPGPSLDLLALIGARAGDAVIDIGGGESRLVDGLLARGFADVSVLDLSATALEAARARLGAAGERAHWIVADMTTWSPTRVYDVWHDRAALHFLTDPADQRAYVARLRAALKPGGCAILATFAPDGPEKCSGLPVRRHDAASLAALLGPDFTLADTRRHDHMTPGGATQRFQFSTFRRRETP
jgi:trans-aconitate methyltransferase